MKAILWLVLSIGVAVAAARDWKEVGGISAIDGISHIHITNLLLSYGIESTIVGSVIHWIEVPSSKAMEAAKLLRDDAPRRSYRVWLAETDETVGFEPEPRVLVSRIAVATVLKQEEFSPKTALGLFLRNKDIARYTTKYPFIISLRIVERRYLATTKDLSSGYNVELDLRKSLRERDDDFGGTYQVYDDGKRIEYLGGHEGTVANPK